MVHYDRLYLWFKQSTRVQGKKNLWYQINIMADVKIFKTWRDQETEQTKLYVNKLTFLSKQLSSEFWVM